MNAKNQKPILRSEKIQSTSFLIWIISGLYLLPMVWLLLSTMVAYGAHETKPWLVPAVAALTVSYGILMLLLWPHEKSLAEVNLINPVFTLTRIDPQRTSTPASIFPTPVCSCRVQELTQKLMYCGLLTGGVHA